MENRNGRWIGSQSAKVEKLLQRVEKEIKRIEKLDPGKATVTPDEMNEVRSALADLRDEVSFLHRRSIPSFAVLGIALLFGMALFATAGWLSRNQGNATVEGEVNLQLVDLDGFDLSRTSLVAADLRGACLRDTFLFLADLSHADLDGADLSGAQAQQVIGLEATTGTFIIDTVTTKLPDDFDDSDRTRPLSSGEQSHCAD